MIDFFKSFWFTLAQMAPWLLVGFVAAGLAGIFVSRSWVERHLSGGGWGPVWKATLFGVPLPLCSCSVIPAGIAFHKQGAGRAATISFLISTPQTGVDSIFLTAGVLGWPFTLLKVFVAVLSGLMGGLLSGEAKRESLVFERVESSITTVPLFKKFWHSTTQDLPAALALPFLLGSLLAAGVAHFVPSGLLGSYLGNGPLALFGMLLFSLPLYVCATGSIPLALLFLQQGLGYGAVLVFLMAGPATNFATMLIVHKNLGTRALLSYLSSIITFSLLAGFFAQTWLLAPTNLLQEMHEHHDIAWTENLSAAILLLLFLPVLWRKLKKLLGFTSKKKSEDLCFLLSGLSCGGCVSKVRRKLQEENISYSHLDVHELLLPKSSLEQKDKVTQILNDLGFGAKEKKGK